MGINPGAVLVKGSNSNEPKAYILIGLGFGDEGKGAFTDYLCRRESASLVIRFNGGAQAGHTVVLPNGDSHIFSQFGSGSFIPGVKTYLSEYFYLDPLALLKENEVIRRVGVMDVVDRLHISEDAKLIIPYHGCLNRIRELNRGIKKHGSCGIGIGEVYRIERDDPEMVLNCRDLLDLQKFSKQLKNLREYLISLAESLDGVFLQGNQDYEDMKNETIFEWILNQFKIVSSFLKNNILDNHKSNTLIAEQKTLVFEGAQGVLLDQDRGFFPHVTPSKTGFENAVLILNRSGGSHEILKSGVMRWYPTRHGEGPFPTEDKMLKELFSEKHNREDLIQGKFRFGWPDKILWEYASCIVGSLDLLAVTHVDYFEKLTTIKICEKYLNQDENGNQVAVNSGVELMNIEIRNSITRNTVIPVYSRYENYDSRDFLDTLPFQAKERILSFGPTANDFRICM